MSVVREEGLEPSRPEGHRHLKPARLPIPPLARVDAKAYRHSQPMGSLLPMTPTDKRARFHQLHSSDKMFVMPNPWDVGSAVHLEKMGFAALATTSSGFAAAMGGTDGDIDLDQLVDHVAGIAAATSVPLNVDAERCFAETTEGIKETVHRVAEAGAAGLSIEDWSRHTGQFDSIEAAGERVSAAVEAANAPGLVLTARAENHIRGVDDLDDTIARLLAYRDAGAHCLYAPGVGDAAAIGRVLEAIGSTPLNVLTLAGTPPLPELAELGVRRVSVGGALAFASYDALTLNAEPLLNW